MNGNYTKGKVSTNIINQAIPLMIAGLVQLLYNVVDRIYIGHLNNASTMALTGIGLVFPLVTLVQAFTSLFGTGAAPLFAIARGEGDDKRAEKILGNTFSLLLLSSFILFVFSFIFKKDILYAFGASPESYIYGNQYLSIYLFGTTFIMLSVGLNGLINAQGYPKVGMLTTMIGAIINLILDPLFIFVLNMGVKGAAIATLIAQFVSFVWVMHFLFFKSQLRIKKENMQIELSLVKEIISIGFAGFIMSCTNFFVQIACNKTLKFYGGDLYIGIMTVISSIRSILELPVSGITNGAQPVISYNYGAKRSDRVKEGIRFTAFIGFVYTLLAWIFVFYKSDFLISIFNNDSSLLEAGSRMVKIYFFGFVFMAFQFAGQTTFQALKYSKKAVFFSLLRKAFIVVPLTILLPMKMGVAGVFVAEPISNVIGGLACFITMYLTVYRKL
ncbi:MAG: MATE family efflux transporter [Erysipelotrichaceae bacterium]|nr:MATE family efflux transporter [Erysipelotrichaceae bacterium]